jgi:NADH-quinone oxidoreductase subunit K
VIQAFVASSLFAVGLYGVLTRRDIVAVLASVEVMMGGALVLLAASGAAAGWRTAEPIAVLLLVVAAGEAAVGLALMVAVARTHAATRIDELREVKG